MFLSHSFAGQEAWQVFFRKCSRLGLIEPSCKRSTSVWIASPTCSKTAFIDGQSSCCKQSGENSGTSINPPGALQADPGTCVEIFFCAGWKASCVVTLRQLCMTYHVTYCWQALEFAKAVSRSTWPLQLTADFRKSPPFVCSGPCQPGHRSLARRAQRSSGVDFEAPPASDGCSPLRSPTLLMPFRPFHGLSRSAVVGGRGPQPPVAAMAETSGGGISWGAASDIRRKGESAPEGLLLGF